MNRLPQDEPDINMVVITKRDSRYVFLFTDDQRIEALRTLGRFASNPDLDFTWYDAALGSQKIRAMTGAKS